MCGIICSKEKIEKLLQKIKHRGPNDFKIIKVNDINFGFVRLSINDKTIEGMQPFQFKNYIGVFNGEIYNYVYLNEKYNLNLKSSCDMELVLPLYDILGGKIIDELDGFYSGLILDTKTDELFALKDFIGKKPLFLVETKNGNYITSELKAISNIHKFNIIPKGFSKIEHFNKLTLLNSHSYLKTDRNIQQILSDAIKKRIPNEKFGIFLSGGLDSSIIAYLALKYSKNIIFYTLGGIEDSDYNNVKKLEVYLNIQNIKYIPIPSKDEIELIIDKVVYSTESYNPSIISNGVGTYLLSKEAHKDGLKVVLGGDGADEVFCGYSICVDNLSERQTLLNNLYFTELRRIDNCSMSHSIEIRVPFLDKEVVSYSNNLNIDLLKDKRILRDSFKNKLPLDIINRKKISFDRGSGLRKIIVSILKKDNFSEKDNLFKIWKKYFKNIDYKNIYFHSYPSFDRYIEDRKES